MYGRNNGQWSFIDMLTLFDTFLQMADVQMNASQCTNNQIMEEIQKQNEKYFAEIIDNQKEILSILGNLEKPMSADR